jgi:hypothetical protein
VQLHFLFANLSDMQLINKADNRMQYAVDVA